MLGFRRMLTALALCKSIESAIQWFQIHHRITFATAQDPAVYLSGARVSIFSTLVPRLICIQILVTIQDTDCLIKQLRVLLFDVDNLDTTKTNTDFGSSSHILNSGRLYHG